MYKIGIDIGGMSIKGGVVDEDGKILFDVAVTTTVYTSEKPITDDIIALVELLLKKASLTRRDVESLGIGSPGAIDPVNGIIKYSNNISMTNVPVVRPLTERFGFPVHIDNDANCAALGEAKFGSGKGAKDIVFVTLGTGVGTGIVSDGRLFTGGGGAGAEGGHQVIVLGGENCTCGRKGCWESYAAASALIRQTAAAMDKDKTSLMHAAAQKEGKISGKTAFTAAKAGDAAAKAVVDKYLEYVICGIVNIVNLFRPETVIIGGGISKEGEYILAPMREYLDKSLFGGKFNPPCKLAIASLSNEAGIIGAAFLE